MTTIKTTDGNHVFGGTVADPSNQPIVGETGDVFAWSTDDPTILQVFASSQPTVAVKPTGKAGNCNLNVSASKIGQATVTGTEPITVEGQVRDHVIIVMQS